MDNLKGEVISWIKTLLFAVICAVIINNFILVNAKVPTGSMENTIMTNDRIIAFRLSYLFSSPERFHIIVFRNPEKEEVLYIKRIIGLPGEVIEIVNGHIYIDGNFIDDSQFIKDEFHDNWGPVTIPQNNFFVLGDNRSHSEDSRYWEFIFVPQDNIVGRAIFKYFRNIEILR